MYYEPYLELVSFQGDRYVASEACGGVVVTNMQTGKDLVYSTTLNKFVHTNGHEWRELSWHDYPLL